MRTIDESQSTLTFPIAFVVARFNQEVTGKLLEGGLARCQERGFAEKDITVVWVPGAVEIPIVAQRLAQIGTFDAIVAYGAVIRGETTHHIYVSEQASQGCQTVSLQNDIPVIFGVLTVDTDEQAAERIGGRHGHKGRDAVDAAVETVAALRALG